MLKVYIITYGSNVLGKREDKEIAIYSDKKLKENEFIVVEHIDYGVFIGKVVEELKNNWYEDDEDIKKNISYRFVKKIDLSDWLKEKENEKRKAELKQQMQERFAVIDEERKYQYYANLDEEMKKLYDEYKNL